MHQRSAVWHAALVATQHTGTITPERLSEVTGVPEDSVEDTLDAMVERGWLTWDGSVYRAAQRTRQQPPSPQ